MSAATDQLEGYLKQLQLLSFSQNYRPFAEDAAKANHGYDQFLLALAHEEIVRRDLNAQTRRLKAAKLPAFKELTDFDFSALPTLNQPRILDLARGDYIDQVEPIILVGNPGLGKTHIALGLAVAACRQKQRVRFYNTAHLVNELIVAQEENRLNKLIATALRHQLIILDELGFIPLSSLGAQLIFQFCSALYEQVALIVTTNLKFADWTQVFGDERLTLALLDRLTHRAHIIEFVGDSFRFRQRQPTEVPMTS